MAANNLEQNSKINFFELALLFTGLVFLTFTLAPEISSDGEIRYTVVEAFLNGKPIPEIKYSIIQPVLSMPIAYIAKIAGLDVERAVSYFNLFAFYVIGSQIFFLLSQIFSRNTAVKSFLVLLSASIFPHHLQHYFGEVFSSLSIVVGFLLAYRNSKFSSLYIALGILNSPALLPPVALAAIFLMRRSVFVMGGVLGGLIFIVIESYLKFNSLTDSPYLADVEKGFATLLPYSGLPGFSYPMFFGVLSIILSFGKGLVFFLPGLLLFLDKKIISEIKIANITGVAMAVFMLSLILVYSKWWAWYGGNFWGPRFFLILAFPTSLALASALSASRQAKESVIVIGILSLSTWVAIDGVVFGQTNMEICWQNNYQMEMLCWYSPEFSALWRPFVVMDMKELINNIISSERFLYFIWQSVVYFYLIINLIFNMLTPHVSLK